MVQDSRRRSAGPGAVWQVAVFGMPRWALRLPASRARTRLDVRACYLDRIGTRSDLSFRDIMDFRFVLVEDAQDIDPSRGNLVELGKPLVTD